jgi:Ran GTPase-activating protein (RanGAP) involved in mRNA processing and transport
MGVMGTIATMIIFCFDVILNHQPAMNYFTTNISKRLAYNDPSLTDISIRRFPLTSVSSDEIVSIVESLQHNTVVKSLDISIPPTTEDNNETDFSAVEINERIPNQEEKSFVYLYDMLRTNTAIDTLTVRDVQSDDAWIAISSGIKLNTSIREVTLGNNANLWSTNLSLVACHSLRSLMVGASNMKCLRLKSYSIMDVHCVREICIGLEQNSGLKEIALHSIECDEFPMILESIAKSKARIEKLSIIDCDLCFGVYDHDTNGHPFTKLFSDIPTTSLKQLRLTECTIGLEEIAALCEGIKFNSSLQLLDLSGCDLLAEVCRPIADMLCTNTALLHLLMEENIIGDHGAYLLSNGLQLNSNLETLDLKANHITEEGCKYIAGSLMSSRCRLCTMILSENPINDVGAKYLGGALRKNNYLTSLNLGACIIGDIGIECICSGLTSNSTLREINMSNNCCKNGCSVSCMLSTNATLESLDMTSCQISNGTLDQMLRSLAEGTNKSLKNLFLSFNTFANKGAETIADMLLGGNKLETISAQFNSFDANSMRKIVSAMESNLYLKSFHFWNENISTDQDKRLIDEMDHFLALNRAGRRALLVNVSTKTIWANILKRADSIYGPTAVFHLLREMPDNLEIVTK